MLRRDLKLPVLAFFLTSDFMNSRFWKADHANNEDQGEKNLQSNGETPTSALARDQGWQRNDYLPLHAMTAPSRHTRRPRFLAWEVSDCQTGIVAVFMPLPIPETTRPMTNCPSGQ
ncbi:hypothetical protein KC326_g28 [Hortaea werneckii]|nr:hypothetical protein KC326_g28 [Hortaea werneckii]